MVDEDKARERGRKGGDRAPSRLPDPDTEEPRPASDELDQDERPTAQVPSGREPAGTAQTPTADKGRH